MFQNDVPSEKNGSKVMIKAVVLLGLIVVLMIPTFLISSMISERKQRQVEAIAEVSTKWGNKQIVSGPVLTVPFVVSSKDKSGVVYENRQYVHILPEKLKIGSKLKPERKYRSIFEVIVYNSVNDFTGSFNLDEIKNTEAKSHTILYDEAFISLGISDLRGVEDQIDLSFGKEKTIFNSGILVHDVLQTGIHARVKLSSDPVASKLYTFDFKLRLKGSEFLHFTPIGKITELKVEAPWRNPSFEGAFLPDERKITKNGFSAFWKILHINRSFPQAWINRNHDIEKAHFGVDLISPIDNYVKTLRSIKYAILFIALTFMLFFFLELINKKFVHPFQYLLIGFALVLFYTLLLSLSEHLNYNQAYICATIMTIGLITFYTKSIFKDNSLALLIFSVLVVLYGFIFTIIQMQDYALLMGSLGLFLILALTMFFSKKIDWKALGEPQID